MISPIHLINLDRSTARLAKFMSVNCHLENVIRVSAADGDLLDRRGLAGEGLITDDLGYLPGSLGCAVSHIRLWMRAVSENKTFTICEDDVIFAEKFQEQSATILRGLPQDWGMIQWGYDFSPKFIWLDFGVVKAKLDFYDLQSINDRSGFQHRNVVCSALRLAHSFGLQAYSVSPKGARTLLNTCLPLRNELVEFRGAGVTIKNIGIDCTMSSAYSLMKAYICMPPLVVHDVDQPSDRIPMDNPPAPG
jgi:GR25 family glycosyltransferase involved in LPS biosynthesis